MPDTAWDEERVVSLETRTKDQQDATGKNVKAIAELSDGMLGTPSVFEVTGRKPDGVIHKIDRIEATLANGIKMRVPAKVWLPPAITTVGAILVAVIALAAAAGGGG